MTTEEPRRRDFIRDIIAEHEESGRFEGRVHTRFPPEPNGYLHIGHAKSICLNFSVAAENGGACNLRFDDTNPTKEDVEFVDSIKADIRWLGFDWEDRLHFASDYFERLYEFAEQLIRSGDAYVDSQPAEEISAQRGMPGKPGTDSPHRDRPVEENLDLFRRMRAGEFEDGACVLRAKIDMASPNLSMRDPNIYRIRHATHHRTGDTWCIYPLYDFTHGLSDSIERITHSLCTLEFENHRPLYDWILEKLGVYRPQQIEFARLNLNYTILSKRRLGRLVAEGHVEGWDDPRMPTLAGIRRRGYPPSTIRTFCDKVGISKANSVSDIALLEHTLRADLNAAAPRRMGVLRPLKVVVTNWPAGEVDLLDAINNPEDASAGSRQVPFSGEFFIERDDFMEDPPKKFFRLGPGREVRLRYAYFVTCTDVIKDDSGEVVELHCTYDPQTRGGDSPDGRKVKGTLHWVSAEHAIDGEVRLYDRLFTRENPNDVPEGGDFVDFINPDSLEVLDGCKLEPALGEAAPGESLQLERLGYFCIDSKDSTAAKPVLNRTVTLRDSWAKAQKK